MGDYKWQDQNISIDLFKNFAAAKDPTTFLTGETSQGAQSFTQAQEVIGKIQTGFNDWYTAQANNLAKLHPDLSPDKFIDPSALGSAYNAGEGATSNRGAVAVRAQMDMAAKLAALDKANAAATQFKTTGTVQSGQDPAILAKLQADYDSAKQGYALAWRDPANKLAMDSAQARLEAYKSGKTGTQLDPAGMEQANAAAARVGAPLPYPNAKVGDITPGGAINNESMATGVPYDKLAKAANAGTPIQPVNSSSAPGGNPMAAIQQDQYGTYTFQGGTFKTLELAKAAAQKAGVSQPNVTASITRDDNGGYIFEGKSYSTLQKAQAQATRSGVNAEYTQTVLPKPIQASISNPNGEPQRSTWAPGPAGDKQYQLAIDRWKAKNNPTPTSLDQVQTGAEFDNFINNAQTAALDAMTVDGVTTKTNSSTGLSGEESYFQNLLSSPSPGSSSTAQPGSSPTPSGPPMAFSAEQKLSQLKQQFGVDPLETQVADLDKQIQDLQNGLIANRNAEQAKKGVTLGVMAGRVSEEERQANERIAALDSQRGYAVAQLQNKYTAVDTLMKAAQTDYSNAKDLYDTQFAQHIQTTNMLMNIDAAQKSTTEKARDDARANVTIVTNALANGTLSWDSLDPSTKSQYTQLELQAGLPTGTISSFSMKQGAQWDTSSILPGVDDKGNQIATILQKNKVTGEFKSTKLITDYAPKPSGSNSNISQKGTYVNNSGQQIAWQIDNQGNKTEIVLGKAKVPISEMNADQKEENSFNTYLATLIGSLGKKDAYGNPTTDYASASRQLKAKYPSLIDEAIKDYLGDPSVYN